MPPANPTKSPSSGPASTIPASAVERVISSLIARNGSAAGERIRRGVGQVAERWWAEDGDEGAFESFCVEHYLATEAEREASFARLGEALEQVDGHLHEVERELHRPIDLDLGPIRRVDLLLQNLDLSAHVDEDLFRTGVAFHALLNFSVHTLEERLGEGASWTREQWARSRMMDRFAERVPAPVLQEISRVRQEASLYIAEYNIYMGRLRTRDGNHPFPEELRLISHWGLREEIRSRYEEGPPALGKQRMIQTVMERIVRQEIPESVRNNPSADWCPETNELTPNGSGSPGREPDTRYRHFLALFHALRAADPYMPSAPNFIRRRFELDRQIPEAEVERLLLTVLESDEVGRCGRLIESRLGRPLEPFDIWYSGFKPRGTRSEEELNRVVRERFPTTDAFQASLPGLLQSLGFTEERARWLSERIEVDPARGAGHAMGAVRRGDHAHLRTRAEGGMSYKAFNIAMHELGHNVEQVFSLDAIDFWSLCGVPNTAFTEAFAFVFQARDLEVLGYGTGDPEERDRELLDALWSLYEVAGVSLIDMRVWHWIYEHLDASPAELREAVVALAKGVWDRWFAPVFRRRGIDLLAIYSHLIDSAMYLPDYALGHIAAFQIADRLRHGDFGGEVERCTRLGRLTPDTWMRAAVGQGLSTTPLLDAARGALDRAASPAPSGSASR
jgi:hypothetical protein